MFSFSIDGLYLNFPDLNIVLYSPQIPPNTGNVARLVSAIGGRLILIGPLGFSLESRFLKRAGLDYWEDLRFSYYVSWEDFWQLELVNIEPKKVFLITSKGDKSIFDLPLEYPAYLIFGNETHGLPDEIHNAFLNNRYRIPMKRGIRCLNLSTSVGIGVYLYINKLFNFSNQY